MVIEALDESLIAQIRSSSAIDSVTQCVTELVLNSLDAKSTSVAIRVNLTTFRIQVVDNGRGISRQNLEFVGIRYMTNKCHTLEDLKKQLKYYGFKGEALANISAVSQKVLITTRALNCEETFVKTIEKNEIKIDLTKSRPSFGTTVTVEGFLNNLPVRQQCVKNNELENIKRSIESLIIIHPRVSFTLRNDLGAKLILSSVKSQDIASSFKTIHPEIDENEFVLLKVSKNKISVEGLIHKNFHENKRLQYVYVNKRPINCPKVQNLINIIFKKSVKGDQKKKTPVFIIHIKCPYSDVDINLEPTKTVVFFKKFDVVKRCIQKMVTTFLGGDNAVITHKSRQKEVASEFGVSQIEGVVKGFGAKRKFDDLEEVLSNHSEIIEDTPLFEEAKVPTKQAKMALPIEVKKNEKKEVEVSDVADKSIFTNFPENEKRGKDLIMDMFIMSLKAYPVEDKENTEGENLELSQDKSVTEELSPSPLKESNKVTLGVQTTLNDVREGMVSVGVQTGFGSIDPHFDGDISFFPRKSLKKFVSDYDFDFSKIDNLPVNFNLKRENDFFENFNQTKKLFDFRNRCAQNFNIFGNRDQPSIYLNENFEIKTDPLVFDVFSKIQNPVQQSPYFVKKPLTKNRLPTSQKDKICICQNAPEVISRNKLTDSDTNVWNGSTSFKNLNTVEMTCIKKSKAKKRLNESNISKYFTPKKNKNFPKIHSYSQNRNSQKPKIQNCSFDESKDLFTVSKSSQMEDLQSNLVITIDEEDKEEIIHKDRSYEQKCAEDFIAPTLTQTQNKQDKGLNVYPRNVLKPSTNLKKDLSFEVMERFDFVPKGLSPILKDYGKVDDLSPGSKEQLQNALIQSYEDELLFIKWQNYIDNKDPKHFFEEIYLEKSKLIEGSIPNISKTGYAKHIKGFEHISFTKSLFKNLEVIGQVDRKFIAALDKTKNLVLLFDQHAVHERVRLEELSESYKSTSVKLDQNITIFLPNNDLYLLKYQKATLKSLGLVLDYFTNGITIFEVPLCVYNKSKKGVDIVSLTEALIKEIVETLKTNNGIIVNTPKVIQNIVNSEACRGAIKFGDLLSKNECTMHLKKLLGCNLPFQCAHGRPTVTPLLFLNKLYDPLSSKPHLHNLK